MMMAGSFSQRQIQSGQNTKVPARSPSRAQKTPTKSKISWEIKNWEAKSWFDNRALLLNAGK